MNVGLPHFLTVSAALFSLGLFAVIIYCGVYSLKGGNVHRASNATLILLIFFFVVHDNFVFCFVRCLNGGLSFEEVKNNPASHSQNNQCR